MRILLVSHDFLPEHSSGTEIYTAQLGARLRARGHQVELLTTEKDVSRPNLRLDRREWDGMVVHELVNNLHYEDFRETWDWPPAVAAFRRVVDRFQPNVVHVMHLMYLSIGLVEEARRLGIPVVYTLHDFWLQCARFGQLIHADGSVCHTIDFARCGSCLARLKFSQTPLERRTARVLAGVRSATGLDLGPRMRAAAGLLGKGRGQVEPNPEPGPQQVAVFAEAMAVRDQAFRQRLVPAVDRFLSPSRFLLERLVAWGIPADRIVHLPNGVERRRFLGLERSRADRVRVAFLGSLVPHKAPHLLLEAWGRLAPDVRARGALTLYGPGVHHLDYVAALRRRAQELGARMGGVLPTTAVPRALGATDLLVVPSVWYENAPLSILEARAARTPVLASDLGGMAELVEEGHHGWRFRPGDVDDLATRIARILSEPELLDALDFGGEPLRDMDEIAAETEELYGELGG